MKVAIYARVSTKDKGQSTHNQLPDLHRYAEAHGWNIYKEYAEEESDSIANRGQFKNSLPIPINASLTWCCSEDLFNNRN